MREQLDWVRERADREWEEPQKAQDEAGRLREELEAARRQRSSWHGLFES